MSGQVVVSMKVATTLAAKRIVTQSSTANTCEYPAAATKLPIGVTLDDVESTSQAIPVAVNGIAPVYFNDTVTCGGLVAADSSGRGIPFTPASTTTGLTLPTGVIGTLIGPTIGLTGTIALVLIQPQLMR